MKITWDNLTHQYYGNLRCLLETLRSYDDKPKELLKPIVILNEMKDISSEPILK